MLLRDRPGHVPLAREVAEYLGFAPDAVPPSYLACARALGRLPSMQIWRDQVYVRMYEHELAGYDGIVAACVLRFFGDCLGVVDIEGTLEEVQQPVSYTHMTLPTILLV